MARFIDVPMKRVPEGATKEERKALYEDYKKRLYAANPHLIGSMEEKRSVFGWLKHLVRGK